MAETSTNADEMNLVCNYKCKPSNRYQIALLSSSVGSSWLIFVTQPLNEAGENYFTWRSTFLNALESKNKVGFVDGSIKKTGVHPGDLQSCTQCNAIVKSWLINSISKDLQAGSTHMPTANEIWADFEERFTQGIALKIYELRRTISLLQQEIFSILSYYGKLKAVWTELQNLRPLPVCTCSAAKKMQEMCEEEKVFDFLMGLDDAFKTVRSQILSIGLLPSLGKAYTVAAQEEKQRQVAASRTPIVEATTLLARTTPMRELVREMTKSEWRVRENPLYTLQAEQPYKGKLF